MKKEKILIVEDNDTMRLGIQETLKRDMYKIFVYDNGPEALQKAEFELPDIAILDLRMEPLNGIEILEKLKKITPNIEVLMISAYGTVEDAVKAMKLGAADFLTKPFSPDELRIRIEKLVQRIQNRKKLESLSEHNRLLREEISGEFSEIIGTSKPIKEIFSLVEKISESDSSVPIHGESGTGKELIARAIHRNSLRNDKPFIKMNCGALNDNLLESELFGHEKGSFTGAIKQKKGRFELADEGTLFLDEIGDISPNMQVKLLRVLQEGEFERVGGEETLKTDVRIIAASNKDLQKSISENEFREDLFYRLSVIPVSVPSLRERRDDIPLLINHFLNKLKEKYNKKIKNISDEGLNALMSYTWPGNIRELENLVERLFFISSEDTIDAELISSQLFKNVSAINIYENMPLEDALFTFEKNLIVQALKKNDGIKNRAAKALGINTSTLYYKLEKYGLS